MATLVSSPAQLPSSLFPAFSLLAWIYSELLNFYFLSVTAAHFVLSSMFKSQDGVSSKILISHVWSTATFLSGYFHPSSSCFIIFFPFIISLPSPRFPFFYLSSHSTYLVKEFLNQGHFSNDRVPAKEKLCSVAVTRYKNKLDWGYRLIALRQ